MLIAPNFTRCVRRSILEWSTSFLPRSACTLTLPLLFKVFTPEELEKKRLETSTQDDTMER